MVVRDVKLKVEMYHDISKKLEEGEPLLQVEFQEVQLLLAREINRLLSLSVEED